MPFAEPQSCLPKNAYEHDHDLLKHCMHNFIRQQQLFGFLHGEGASLGHIFKIHLSPDNSPHKLAFGETCTFVHAVR
jgi:hypothetical protein